MEVRTFAYYRNGIKNGALEEVSSLPRQLNVAAQPRVSVFNTEENTPEAFFTVEVHEYILFDAYYDQPSNRLVGYYEYMGRPAQEETVTQCTEVVSNEALEQSDGMALRYTVDAAIHKAIVEAEAKSIKLRYDRLLIVSSPILALNGTKIDLQIKGRREAGRATRKLNRS